MKVILRSNMTKEELAEEFSKQPLLDIVKIELMKFEDIPSKIRGIEVNAFKAGFDAAVKIKDKEIEELKEQFECEFEDLKMDLTYG